MNNLTNLNLVDNRIKDISIVECLKSLEYISISNNMINAIDPIFKCYNLLGIKANGNNITSIDGLQNLKN